MTAEQFAYWLQGFVELNGAAPSEAQWKLIQAHLKTVFHKVTPPFQQAAPNSLGDDRLLRQVLNPHTVTIC